MMPDKTPDEEEDSGGRGVSTRVQGGLWVSKINQLSSYLCEVMAKEAKDTRENAQEYGVQGEDILSNACLM